MKTIDVIKELKNHIHNASEINFNDSTANLGVTNVQNAIDTLTSQLALISSNIFSTEFFTKTQVNWIHDGAENIYKLDINHTLSSNKIIATAYETGTLKQIDITTTIIDNDNVSLSADIAYDCEVYLLSLDKISTKVQARSSNAIEEADFTVLSTDWVQDTIDNDFYEYTLNHQLDAIIADIRCTVNGEDAVVIVEEIDKNNIKLIVLDDSLDLDIKIVYECLI